MDINQNNAKENKERIRIHPLSIISLIMLGFYLMQALVMALPESLFAHFMFGILVIPYVINIFWFHFAAWVFIIIGIVKLVAFYAKNHILDRNRLISVLLIAACYIVILISICLGYNAFGFVSV